MTTESNPWEVLEVRPGASKEEIRKAFRAKIKKLHPDSGGQSGQNNAEVARVVDAYKALLSGVIFYTSAAPQKPFDYREFLLERPEPRWRARLVLLDLLKGREDEAIGFYLDTELICANFLFRYLDRDDALDTVYLLAGAFRSRGEYWKALDLLLRIGEEEVRKPYFRIFYVEVQYQIRTLLTVDVVPHWDVAERLFQIRRALPCISDTYERSRLVCAAARIYQESGQTESALDLLREQLAVNPKDREANRLLREWERSEGPSRLKGPTPPGSAGSPGGSGKRKRSIPPSSNPGRGGRW